MTFLTPGQERLGLDRVRPADHRPPGDVDRLGPDRDEGLPGVVLDLVLERAGRRRELDRQRHRRLADHDVLDHAEGDDVLAQLGFLDGAERVVDRAFGQSGHGRLGSLAAADGRIILTVGASIS